MAFPMLGPVQLTMPATMIGTTGQQIQGMTSVDYEHGHHMSQLHKTGDVQLAGVE